MVSSLVTSLVSVGMATQQQNTSVSSGSGMEDEEYREKKLLDARHPQAENVKMGGQSKRGKMETEGEVPKKKVEKKKISIQSDPE